ncbi:MAG: hypothetical protein WDZ88_00525 [Candidatus Paceibacterota bacterium]
MRKKLLFGATCLLFLLSLVLLSVNSTHVEQDQTTEVIEVSEKKTTSITFTNLTLNPTLE